MSPYLREFFRSDLQIFIFFMSQHYICMYEHEVVQVEQEPRLVRIIVAVIKFNQINTKELCIELW